MVEQEVAGSYTVPQDTTWLPVAWEKGKAVPYAPALVTNHAAMRWKERCGPAHRIEQARVAVGILYNASFAVPNRVAQDLWAHAEEVDIAFGKKMRLSGFRYLVHGSTMLICRGRTVVTVIRSTEEQLADLLWWAMTGRLPEQRARAYSGAR